MEEAGEGSWRRLRRQTHLILDGGTTHGWAALVHPFIVVLIVASVASVVLETVPALHARFGWLFALIEVAAVSVFTVEYLLRLWSAPEDLRLGGKSNASARAAYARSPLAIIDLLAIAPIYLEGVVAESFGIVAILRLFRFFKLTRYSPGMRSLIAAVQAERKALAASSIILFGLIVIAATAMHMVEAKAQPDRFGTIPDAMWWAIVTLTTVGYGDVVPVTLAGRIVAGFTMVAGMMMLALPIGIVATAFNQEIHRREFVVTWEMVAKVPLFSSLDASEVSDIMRYLRAQTAPAGALIARRGEPADSMFFISSGEVEIDLPNESVRLGEGHFFGEIAVLHSTRRSGNVRALRPTKLLVLDSSDLHLVMARKPDIARRIHDVARERADVARARSDILPDELKES